jgi:hypothetical protein
MNLNIVTCLVECHRYYTTLLSLLGNRKLDTSTDTLTTPVQLRCMATNIRKASVSVGPAGVELNLRPTVIRSVCLSVGPPFGAHDQILHVL